MKHMINCPPPFSPLVRLSTLWVFLAGFFSASAIAVEAPKTTPPAKTGSLEELSLEELMNVKVSTVSRVDERIDEAPGSIYLYPRRVIQDRGYRSLGELLQTVPGFTVFHRDLDFVVGA